MTTIDRQLLIKKKLEKLSFFKQELEKVEEKYKQELEKAVIRDKILNHIGIVESPKHFTCVFISSSKLPEFIKKECTQLFDATFNENQKSPND